MNLTELFQSIVKPQGRRTTWPPLLFVEAWLTFVEEVISGYSGDLYEYENELSVRDELETALTDDRLAALEGWAPFAESVREADERLRTVLAQGPLVRSGNSWWRERLPASAGDELVADAARLFNVVIDVG